MGCYDTFGTPAIQLKVGPCLFEHYYVGDECPLEDGIYCGYEGVVVVKDGKLIATFEREEVRDKWGAVFPLEPLLDKGSPIAAALVKRKKGE